MRITADVNSVIPGGINVKQSAGVLNRKAGIKKQPVPASKSIQSSFVSRLQRERALGDALSIAQMSQSVIQKAMNVTSRLRSIASQAFGGSGVNTEDLNRVLSQIDNIIGEYGESVPTPAVDPGQGRGSNMATAVENLERLRETAGGMNRENGYSAEVISRQLERFTGMEKTTAGEIKSLKESMKGILSEYPRFDNTDIAAMNRTTVEEIGKSAAGSARTHNNLNAGTARLNLYV